MQAVTTTFIYFIENPFGVGLIIAFHYISLDYCSLCGYFLG